MARSADNFPIKRIELLKIAEKVFIDKGYDQTNIADIMEVAGISKGAFYHYFKSKDEVLEFSIDNLMDEAVVYLQPIVDDVKMDAMEKFRKFMIKKTAFQMQKLDYATLLGKLMQSDVFQYKYILIASSKMVPLFAKIIQQGVDEGIFRVKYPLETADIIIRAISSVPGSDYYTEYITDEERQKRYISSLQGVIGGTLGIESSKVVI